jgi:hypothetical protein
MELAFYIYLGCLLFGLFFSIISGIFGGVFGADMGGADTDIGGFDGDVDAHVDITADSVALSPLSPVVMCFFVGVFGGMGMICLELFHTGVALSILIAALVALISDVGFFYLISTMMVKVQGSMSLSADAIVGHEAEVSLAIPRGGLGEITFVANEMRQRASAKSKDGRPIPQSAVVKVVKYTGNFYLVQRAD